VPGAYTILPARSLVLTWAWGVLTDQELIDHARTLSADPRFGQDFAQLSDLREVTDLRVTSAGVRTLASINPFGAGARRALLTSADSAFGMARMYELMRDNASSDAVHVFRELETALQWLKASVTEVERVKARSKLDAVFDSSGT
jgi:hypothetical protein